VKLQSLTETTPVTPATTPAVTPPTTPTTPTPVPAQLALPTKAVAMTKDFVSNTVLTKCSAPTTIDLTVVLSKMPGGKINIVQVPLNGVMSQPSPTVWLFTPNSNFCSLGGNDQLIMQVVDANGNMMMVQRNLSAVQQGDIPSIIQTGFGESEGQNPLNSNAYSIFFSWVLLTIFVNIRRRFAKNI
jgi:hypothetical protein